MMMMMIWSHIVCASTDADVFGERGGRWEPHPLYMIILVCRKLKSGILIKSFGVSAFVDKTIYFVVSFVFQLWAYILEIQILKYQVYIFAYNWEQLLEQTKILFPFTSLLKNQVYSNVTYILLECSSVQMTKNTLTKV